MEQTKNISLDNQIFQKIAVLIEESRRKVFVAVNSEMLKLYWQIGQLIRQNILKRQKPEYGKNVIANLAKKLSLNYGRGFNERNLFHMLHLFDIFPEYKMIEHLSTKLTWTHLREIIYIQDELKRSFYLEMCRLERWSSRILKERIASMLYERTAISRRPQELIQQELTALKEQNRLSHDLVFRDPYLLGFLGLEDTYSEKDLENAILHKLEKFLVEFGSDFAFLGRQKRITIDNEDFYIDLLFYHRGLHCLVVLELKLDKFRPEYKGQIELYLRYLEKYEIRSGDNPPIGLILCSYKSQEIAELMMLDQDRIKVAEYWTKLPPKKLLEHKLHLAMEEVKKETVASESTVDNRTIETDLTEIQKRILQICQAEWKSCKQILKELKISRNKNFKQSLKELLEKESLIYLCPTKPKSRHQKYKAASV